MTADISAARGGQGAMRIASQIRQAILEGEYRYLERLPAERQLARQFGSARGTVRQALRRLEEMDLVQRRVGSGTYITHTAPPDHEQIAESTSPLELLDVRLVVEPNLARMAVVNANAKDLRNMDRALVSLERAAEDVVAFSKADEAFHLAMARCAHNPLLEWIYRLINDVRGHRQWDASKDKILTADNISEYNAQHRALYEAIRQRDPNRAIQVITAHLNKAKAQFTGDSLDGSDLETVPPETTL